MTHSYKGIVSDHISFLIRVFYPDKVALVADSECQP